MPKLAADAGLRRSFAFAGGGTITVASSGTISFASSGGTFAIARAGTRGTFAVARAGLRALAVTSGTGRPFAVTGSRTIAFASAGRTITVASGRAFTFASAAFAGSLTTRLEAATLPGLAAQGFELGAEAEDHLEERFFAVGLRLETVETAGFAVAAVRLFTTGRSALAVSRTTITFASAFGRSTFAFAGGAFTTGLAVAGSTLASGPFAARAFGSGTIAFTARAFGRGAIALATFPFGLRLFAFGGGAVAPFAAGFGLRFVAFTRCVGFGVRTAETRADRPGAERQTGNERSGRPGAAGFRLGAEAQHLSNSLEQYHVLFSPK
jgi:hypothetical protein